MGAPHWVVDFKAMFLSEMLDPKKVSKITLVDKMWPRYAACDVV